MDCPLYLLKARRMAEDAPDMQLALAQLHGTAERPRCLCVRGGVEMYIAAIGHAERWVLKRMPGTGSQHHPSCKSYEPDLTDSGLGELIGDAVVETDDAMTEIFVNFSLKKGLPRATVPLETTPTLEVKASKRKMSLQAVMHFLFDRAGFNRWSPAMEGKRSQAVLHKYLMEVADNTMLKGAPLSTCLVVPEQFSEQRKTQIAERRRSRLTALRAGPGDSTTGMAIALGEFKCAEPAIHGRRIVLKHMADMPLFADDTTWQKVERAFAPSFLMKEADPAAGFRLIICALIYPKTESAYVIHAASVMATTATWLPVDNAHEAQLVHHLVATRRHFIRPLRYDSRRPARFATALLLDAGARPVPLHAISTFASESEKADKSEQLHVTPNAWVWHSEQPMPPLPPRVAVRRS